MWDIVKYTDIDLSMILKSRDGYSIFRYPWDAPVPLPHYEGAGKPEAINIEQGRLFAELALRARFCALLQLIKLARSGMNGGIPTTLEQIHYESLKFALRRYSKKLITGPDFIGMLRSAAIVETIPEGYWDRLSEFLRETHLRKLKESMLSLSVFHGVSDRVWLEDVQPYMSRTLWFANDFDSIKTVAKQLALLFPDVRDSFNEIGDKASSMIMKAEIEADQASQKPWQRAAGPSLKRQVKTGPSSRSAKKTVEDDGEKS